MLKVFRKWKMGIKSVLNIRKGPEDYVPYQYLKDLHTHWPPMSWVKVWGWQDLRREWLYGTPEGLHPGDLATAIIPPPCSIEGYQRAFNFN